MLLAADNIAELRAIIAPTKYKSPLPGLSSVLFWVTFAVKNLQKKMYTYFKFINLEEKKTNVKKTYYECYTVHRADLNNH